MILPPGVLLILDDEMRIESVGRLVGREGTEDIVELRNLDRECRFRDLRALRQKRAFLNHLERRIPDDLRLFLFRGRDVALRPAFDRTIHEQQETCEIGAYRRLPTLARQFVLHLSEAAKSVRLLPPAHQAPHDEFLVESQRQRLACEWAFKLPAQPAELDRGIRRFLFELKSTIAGAIQVGKMTMHREPFQASSDD